MSTVDTPSATQPPARRVMRDLPPLAPEIRVLTVVAVAVGVVLRFVVPSPMWLDEALSANIAALPPTEMFDALRSDGHPPLYYLVLHWWMQAFGESDAAIRALSGLFSVLTLPLMWLVGRRLGGAPLAWIATATVAMSPLFIRYGGENRMYALVAFGVLAAWLVIDNIFAEQSRWWRVPLLSVITAALLLSHYWALFLGAVVAACVLAVAVRGKPGWRTGAWWVLGGLAGGLILFLPWVPTLLDQLATTATPWAGPSRPGAALGIILVDLAGAPPPEAVLVAAVMGVTVVLALMATPTADDNRLDVDVRTVAGVRTEALVAFGVLTLGTTVAAVSGTAVVSRYAMVIAPLVMVVVALGVAVVANRVARIVMLGVLMASGAMLAVYDLATPRTQMGEIAAVIAPEASPADVVAYCPDQLGPAGDRALRQRWDAGTGTPVTQVVIPTLGEPQFVDWVDYAERNASADPAQIAGELSDLAGPGGAVWLVWDGSYRTYEGLCENVAAKLGTQFTEVVTVVESGNGDYFEHAAVIRFTR